MGRREKWSLSGSERNTKDRLLIGKQLITNLKICYEASKDAKVMVPVLIPTDTEPALEILCNHQVRQMLELNEKKEFLFANTQNNDDLASGCHAVKEICNAASITSNISATGNKTSTVYAALD